ncbi:MAG: DNA-3-methyladenine glycosylase 2 family protein [Pseudomonadota bacterium]
MAALTAQRQAAAVRELTSRDADLAAIVDRCGAPPFWSRPQGFATLVYIVLEQQVSLASARASYDRVTALLPEFTPQAFLKIEDTDLRACGFSRQKTRYTRLIAEAIVSGKLPLARLGRFSDERVRAELTAITGVGDWTAEIYMMTALRRPDLWPLGDLAMVKAIRDVKGLAADSDRDRLHELGEGYRPYRSVAAQLYWRHYLTPKADSGR